MNDPSTDGAPAAARRREPRKRPSKSLPTDRMRFEVQLRVLQTLGRMSGSGQRPIDALRLSQAMNGEVSHYTVGLSHNFFFDAGWLEKRGRGEYAAAPVLLDYLRRSSTGTEPAKAASILKDSAMEAWFWRAIEPQLAHGPVPPGEILVTLMQEAEVGDAHLPQIRTLLEWLRFVGLIAFTDDGIAAADAVQSEVGTAGAQPGEARREPAEQPPSSPAAVPVQTHVTETRISAPATAPVRRGDSVLSLDVSLQLSAADLAQLSAEQIQALFQAVGTVLAIQNSSQQ